MEGKRLKLGDIIEWEQSIGDVEYRYTGVVQELVPTCYGDEYKIVVTKIESWMSHLTYTRVVS